jgi:hypothetical protein
MMGALEKVSPELRERFTAPDLTEEAIDGVCALIRALAVSPNTHTHTMKNQQLGDRLTAIALVVCSALCCSAEQSWSKSSSKRLKRMNTKQPAGQIVPTRSARSLSVL